MRKTRLKMKGLADDIGRFWASSTAVPGALVREEGVRFDQVDDVINALDAALANIRVIEVTGFRGAYHGDWSKAYQEARASDRFGKAVAGVVGPRNVVIHAPDVVEPPARRVVGPSLEGTFAVDFCWKKTNDVPRETFCGQGGKFNKSYRDEYESAVSGRRVLDVLMDAFWFFCLMAPEVVDFSSQGAPAGFPLASSQGVFGYRRLSPEWPSEEEVDLGLIDQVRQERPAGKLRQVTSAFVHADDGLILCGWTQKASGRRARFAEPAQQVARDIGYGMPHSCTATTGEVVDLTVGDDDALRLDGDPIGLTSLPDADPAGEWQEGWDWPAYYEFLMHNVDKYRDERQQGA